jgi:hypothetical protein
VSTDVELRRLAAMTPPGADVMFNNIPCVRDAKQFSALLGALPELRREAMRWPGVFNEAVSENPSAFVR